MSDVVIFQGSGIAACCCAALLSRAGWQIGVAGQARATGPQLMLSQQTQTLLTDVFQGDLFAGAVPIHQRIVLWGQGQQPCRLPHSGLVIAESTLLQRLWRQVNVTANLAETAPAWNVISASQFLPSVSLHEFGTRIASTYSVELSADAQPGTCWIESVQTGWLFLIPCGDNMGSLIAVGAAAGQLLDESRLIKRQINQLGAATGRFPAHPRLVKPLGGAGWLACGTAALAFDPIAGEGTGHALREGILAGAVILASGGMGVDEDLFSHYSHRMLSGLLRHLQDCSRFYAIGLSPWWESEWELLQQGIRWLQDELTLYAAAKYRLIGFELHKNPVQ